MNVGGSEILIIAALALLLFGPTIVAFWLGYVIGQRKKDEDAAGELAAQTPEYGADESPADDDALESPAENLGEEGTHD